MNKARLKGVIVSHGDTQTALADYLHISLSALSLRINGHGKGFRQKEMDAIKQRYNLSAEEMDGIFFSRELS